MESSITGFSQLEVRLTIMSVFNFEIFLKCPDFLRS